MDDSNEGRYNVVIGSYLFTASVIDLNFYDNTIECGKVPHQGCTSSMVNLNNYNFNPINGKMLPFSEESFNDAYMNAFYEY